MELNSSCLISSRAAFWVSWPLTRPFLSNNAPCGPDVKATWATLHPQGGNSQVLAYFPPDGIFNF
jgi:hypothetical protein